MQHCCDRFYDPGLSLDRLGVYDIPRLSAEFLLEGRAGALNFHCGYRNRDFLITSLPGAYILDRSSILEGVPLRSYDMRPTADNYLRFCGGRSCTPGGVVAQLRHDRSAADRRTRLSGERCPRNVETESGEPQGLRRHSGPVRSPEARMYYWSVKRGGGPGPARKPLSRPSEALRRRYGAAAVASRGASFRYATGTIRKTSFDITEST